MQNFEVLQPTNLSSISIQDQGFDIVCMSLQLHQFHASPWVPNPQNLLCWPGDDDRPHLIHRYAVYWILVSI